MNILITCQDPGLSNILNIIKKMIGVVQIIGPIVFIIALIISLVRMINNPDDKKEPKKIRNSLIAIVVLFFIPMLINVTMSILGEDYTISSCWNNIVVNNNSSHSYIDPKTGKKKSKFIPDNKYEKGDEKKQEEENNNNGNSNQPVSVSTSGLSSTDFNSKLSSMNTPSNNDLLSAAKANNIDSNYLIIILGTTEREGYIKDPYLYYGWASAMINNKVSINTMQGWDPYHSGEANYYSWTNIKNGYDNASSNAKKAVYLALTNRNTKIVECNGMYKTTPSSYNLIYKSNQYNCSIYEKK